jgi:predicted transcriptional regulator of viral defense system
MQMTHAVYDPLPALLRRAVKVVWLRENPDEPMPEHPAFAHLVRRGMLHRIAAGYYSLVPGDKVGDSWQPKIEAASWGIAAADDGPRSVSLMGLSAAKAHGAVGATLTAGVIATTRSRPPIRFTDREGTAYFIRRDPAKLRIKRHTTDLGPGWITTVEQTLLDLATYPQLGGHPEEARAAITGLIDKADPHVLASLATAQRRQGALDRILQQI